MNQDQLGGQATNGIHFGVPAIEELPEGFFESNPRGAQPKRIFDDDNIQPRGSLRRNGSVEAQDMRSEIKQQVSAQLKAYLDSMKVDIMSEFNAMMNQSQSDDKINRK